MEFVVKVGNPEKLRSACVVVGVFETRRLSAAAAALNEASQTHLAKILRLGDMDGKPGSRLMLHKLDGLACERVLLIGLGKEAELNDKTYREAVRLAVREAAAMKLDELTCYLPEVSVKDRAAAWNAGQLVLVAEESLYRSDRLKSKKDEAGSLKKITLGALDRTAATALQAGVKRGVAVAAGMNLTKDLGNLPGNICTPSYLADQAKSLAKTHGFKVEVMGEDKIRKLGMGSFLSVAKGSDEPPRFIVLEHKGGKKSEKPVVLVGKGITFDSGGISLKPGAEMDEMKYDMCGAASVLGTFRALADLKLPINVIGLIPTCENLPSGRANKPGDIVTAMSGLTIEVLNTDAEGRLILCDALTYAERFEPACVVDIATLTGACVIALGHVASGLLANDDNLAAELTAAGEASGDRCWRMPLWDEYQEQLKSNFADLANIGGRAGGTITAACFLSNFTENYKWAHLDIAGTAWKSGKEKGGTGRPVPLLVHFLESRSK